MGSRGVKRRDDDNFPPFASRSRKFPRLDCSFINEQEECCWVVNPRLLQDQTGSSFVALHDDVVPIASCEIPRDRDHGLQPLCLLRSPSSPLLEITVHPDLVDALKNYQYQNTSAYTPQIKGQHLNYSLNTSNLALIPWVDRGTGHQSISTLETMEADNDSEMIDTEDCKGSTNTSDGPPQHQQPQHCFAPQISQNAASSVSWW